MVVEVFNGVADGRVYSGGCVTTVDGDIGRPIEPRCPAKRGTDKEIAWNEENDRRVEQLRALQLTSARKKDAYIDIHVHAHRILIHRDRHNTELTHAHALPQRARAPADGRGTRPRTTTRWPTPRTHKSGH